MASVTQIAALLQMVDAFLGSAVAQGLLGLIKQHVAGLTDAQKAQLDANHADYEARKARLQSEIDAQGK